VVEVNWTLLSFIFVALFALSGFMKGWWKEAITTFFLGILVFFLQVPEMAVAFIDSINWVLEKIWGILPDSLAASLVDFMEQSLNLNIPPEGPQLDPTNPNTWLAILLLFVGFSILLSRLSLRRDLSRPQGRFYAPSAIGSLLGGLLGAFNGFLIINLIREYLDGRALPGELTLPGTSSFGASAANLSIQATDLPSITILDTAIPWVVILVSIGLLVIALVTRLSRDGMNISAGKKVPYGYRGYEVIPKPAKKEGA
jgi:hypothetical protein